MNAERLVQAAISARQRAEAAESTFSPHRWAEADAYAELSRIGWSQTKIALACGSSQPAVSRLITCATRYPLVDNRPTFWAAFADVTGKRPHVSHNSGRIEWYTPLEYLNVARDVL